MKWKIHMTSQMKAGAKEAEEALREMGGDPSKYNFFLNDGPTPTGSLRTGLLLEGQKVYIIMYCTSLRAYV